MAKNLSNSDFVKIGHEALETFQKRNQFGERYTCRKKVKILSKPRLENGQFCSPEDINGFVKVIDEFGNVSQVQIWDLEPCQNITRLSFSELEDLRREICIGSVYLADYRNSFDVWDQDVSDYCDGYMELLEEIHGEDWEKFESPTAFAEYVSRYCES